MGLYLTDAEGSALSREMQFCAVPAVRLFNPDRVYFALLPNPWGVSIAVLFSRAEAERFILGRPDAVFAWVDREAFIEEVGPEKAASYGYGSSVDRKDHTDASL